MEFKTAVRNVFLALSLTSVTLPAWCAAEAQAAAKPVNINTADASVLAEGLKGVGQSKAQAIVAYRKEHGPFKSAEQLSEVKGIGDKLVQDNRDRIVVK
jgi:competence protein ComEA